MTPKRGDVYYLDWQRRDVGRIVRAVSTDARTYKRVLALLDTLHERGRLDLLRAIQDGTLTPLEVYDAARRESLAALPTAETLVPLADAMTAWASRAPCALLMPWTGVPLRSAR